MWSRFGELFSSHSTSTAELATLRDTVLTGHGSLAAAAAHHSHIRTRLPPTDFPINYQVLTFPTNRCARVYPVPAACSANPHLTSGATWLSHQIGLLTIIGTMPEYVYALHDFHPEHEDEIAFYAGQPIEVMERDDQYSDGWWQVSNIRYFHPAHGHAWRHVLRSYFSPTQALQHSVVFPTSSTIASS